MLWSRLWVTAMAPVIRRPSTISTYFVHPISVMCGTRVYSSTIKSGMGTGVTTVNSPELYENSYFIKLNKQQLLDLSVNLKKEIKKHQIEVDKHNIAIENLMKQKDEVEKLATSTIDRVTDFDETDTS